MIAPANAQHIRARILWPVALALGLLLLLCVFAFYRYALAELERQATQTAQRVSGLLQMTLDQGSPSWSIDASRGGLLELERQIDRLAPRLKESFGVDLIVLIDKQFLDQAAWRERRRAAGRDADWARLTDAALVGGTVDPPPDTLATAYRTVATQPQSGANPTPVTLTAAGRNLVAQSLPLRDATGRRIGQFLILDDITAGRDATRSTIAILGALAVGLGTLLIGLLALYLGRVQDSLSRLFGDLSATVERQGTQAQRLIAEERSLEIESARRADFVVEEQTLGTLLRLALAESDARSFLEASVDALLDLVPWLKLQPRGGVLLTESAADPPMLRLVAARNLAAERLTKCAAIPFGVCLCGQAAATRGIIHSDGISPDHAHCMAEVRDHGHYNVPILHGDRVLGVLVLYLVPGHPGAERELQFLGRVADVLSMGITRRQAEEDLRVARDAAQAGSRAKSEFLASMSHEIRTPMNGVLGMAELLADMELGTEQREFVDTIKKSGQALLTIINDILDFSKIESGRLELECLPFDLGRAAHEVTHLLSTRAEQKGLELILDYQPDCPRYVIGDPGRVRQILLNLAGNAVKFTDKGHVLVSVRRLSEAGGVARIHVRVEDTGIGIPAAGQERLFASFVQADLSTTRRYGGTGLGLAISRQLVEMMGGEIGLSSPPDKGATFWFTLPLPLASAPAPAPPAADLTGVHALIVEDNLVNQRVFQEQLRSFGIRTQVVGDPRQALDALHLAAAAGDPFQLALLDHMMPSLDGEQLARLILADVGFPPLPLVLLTSSGQRGDGQRYRQAGFAAYLMKPVLIETLRQCLSRLLIPSQEATAARPLETRHSLTEAVEAATLAGSRRHYRGRVLLAEDNAINRKVALGMLRKLGVEVDSVENGAQAVERCGANSYHLILMDCQMPILDGFEATRRIRDLGGSHRPIIVALTANAMESDRQRCIAAGMDDYVSKPFRQKDLIDAFERWLPPE